MLASSVAAVISLKKKKSCSNCSSFHNIYRFFYQSQYSLDRASLYKWPWAPLSSYWLLRVEKRGLWEKMLPGGEILFSSVQSLSRLRLFATPWIAARQTSLSITNSPSLLELLSIELVMPSSHLILCRPLLLLPPIFHSVRVFSNESTLRMRWPKDWSFSFNISPSSERGEWKSWLKAQYSEN